MIMQLSTWSYDLVFPVCKCVLHWFTCSVIIHISWNIVTPFPHAYYARVMLFFLIVFLYVLLVGFFAAQLSSIFYTFYRGIEFSFSMYIPYIVKAEMIIWFTMIKNNNSLTCILVLTEMCYYHVRHYEFYHVNVISNIMSINIRIIMTLWSWQV